MAKFLQNKVAESNYTLPVASVYAVAVWLLCGLMPMQLYPQLAMFAMTVALLVELNNRNALLRIRSRMVSVSYILIWCMANFLFADITAHITALGTAFMLTFLFLQYQDKKATGYTFYTFASIGVVSLFWIQIVFFVPVVWLVMALHIQSLSWKTFAASLIGLIAPYWFAAAYFFIVSDIATPIAHIMAIAEFPKVAAFGDISVGMVAAFAIILLLAGIGFVHYLQESYLDKIQNRMLYYSFAWLNVATLVFIVLQPQHFECLMAMMIVFTCPVIAHFVALTRSRITNIITWIAAALILIVTILNLWIPSLKFSQVMDI